MEYIVINTNTTERLAAEVNERLKQGYELAGPLVVDPGEPEGYSNFYLQPMIKKS